MVSGFISGEVGISAALDTFSTVYELPLTHFEIRQTDKQTNIQTDMNDHSTSLHTTRLNFESKWPNAFMEKKIMKKLTQKCTDMHTSRRPLNFPVYSIAFQSQTCTLTS